MSDIEDLLRTAMKDHTEQLMTAPGIARHAIRRAGRTRRAHYAATASLAALGTTATVGVVSHHAFTRTPPTGRQGVCDGAISAAASDLTAQAVAGLASPAASPVASPATSPFPASSAATFGSGSDSSSAASAAIKAVRLPNPAPGFPLRREPDSVTENEFGPDGEFWTATFLLGVTPGRTVGSGPGFVEVDPTGKEATVLVSDGHPFDLSSPTTIDSLPVMRTLEVQGHEAYVTATCEQTTIYLTTGRFQVEVTGFGGTTVGEMVELENSLSGLQ